MICFIFCTTKSCKVLHTNSRNTFSFQTKGGEKWLLGREMVAIWGAGHTPPSLYKSRRRKNFMLTNVDGLSFVLKS
jgi:hypothetical protein